MTLLFLPVSANQKVIQNLQRGKVHISTAEIKGPYYINRGLLPLEVKLVARNNCVGLDCHSLHTRQTGLKHFFVVAINEEMFFVPLK